MHRAGLVTSGLLGLALCTMIATALADSSTVPPPPATPTRPVTETFHGQQVVDPYRWLENGEDPAVRQWSEGQTRHARAVLDQNPDLPAIRARVKELVSHRSASYSGLTAAGGKLFA